MSKQNKQQQQPPEASSSSNAFVKRRLRLDCEACKNRILRDSLKISKPATRTRGAKTKPNSPSSGIWEQPSECRKVEEGKAKAPKPAISAKSRTGNNAGVASVSESNITIARKGKAAEAAAISRPSTITLSRTPNVGVAMLLTQLIIREKLRLFPFQKPPNATTILDKERATVGREASSNPSTTTGTKVGKGSTARKGVIISKPPVRIINTVKRQVGRGKNAEEKSRIEEHPVHYIAWDGGFYGESCEPVDQHCLLCEQGLYSLPAAYDDDDDDDDGFGFEDFLEDLEYYYSRQMKLPDVAVLACGHSFHAQCLEGVTPEDQLSDPPCFVCLSVFE